MSYDRPRSRSGMKPRGYVVDTAETNMGKGLIALDHGCYICGRVYSSAGTARNHIRNVHGYEIPGRINGVNRPLDKKYNYIARKDTVKYNEAHYACPSCWFHCPMDNFSLLHDHTITEHKPKRIMFESEDEYDIDMSTNSHRRGSAERPRSFQNGRPHSRNSRPSSRQSNRSTNSRPSSRQGYVSSDEEEVPRNRPSSRQVRILDDREDISPISEGDKNELAQKIDELRELFHALFRK